jgi:hypothetical protein
MTTATTAKLTRADIENLTVGDMVSETYDSRDGIPTPGAVWSSFHRIVSISFRGVSVKGLAYVGGYCDFGSYRMSFDMVEGDARFRIVKAD